MPDDTHTQPLLIEMAIEPKSKAEQEKLEIALTQLVAEDTSFRVSIDHESGQLILKGTSESYLEGKVDILKRTYKVDANVGYPRVVYHERITRPAEVEYTYKKQSGGSGQFAVVKLQVEPDEPGKGYEFECRIVGGALPKEYISGVEKGVQSVLDSGVVAGFPVVDVKVALVGGEYHDVDSSALAFEIAARTALREALQKGKSVLLEPIMKVEVRTPSEFAGAVIDDLGLRRGEIQRKDTNAATISAMVPLMNMFGYGDTLRVMSRGRASFTMQFDHYAPAAPLPEVDPPFRPAIGMRA
jgi:elongation factor G